jgi:hypothetical protein
MKKLFVSAAAATMLMAAAPAFASSPADEAEQGLRTYPSAGQCHFVRERMVTQNRHIVFERHQVCN